MRSKVPRYRRLAESLARLGDDSARAITTSRYRLMYNYFVRCCGLTSAIILLIEAGHVAAAYALEKSLVDALLSGLYLGYVASEKEIADTVALALKGRCTGHSSMKKRARMLDSNFSQRRSFTTGMFEDMVKRTGEQLNEFGHGGLLSTALEIKSLPAEVENKLLAQSVFVLIIFLGNVFVLENLDLTPLEALQKEFQGTQDELVTPAQYL